MATAIMYRPELSRTQEFAHTDVLSAFSSLAMKQPRTNRLAAWILDEDAPFSEQPPAKRIQVVLHSVHKFEVHFTKQTKPANDIVAVIARLALLNGYAAISQITSASGQSHGGRASHSGRGNSGGAGQSALRPTAPPGAGNGGGGPSKRPMKRGGSGDGEGGPNKRNKQPNESQGSGPFRCIIFELTQQLPGKDCAKIFADLGALVNHHLRKHVGHIQCETCFIRKGTTTDMNKHKQPCTPPAKIRAEIEIHGQNIRGVKSWDELKRQVAPNGEIQYDMANDIDRLPQPPVADNNNHVEQPAAPPQHQMSPVDMPSLGDDTTGCSVLEMLHNNPFGYPLYSSGGFSPDLSALMQMPDTVDPQYLVKSNFDSGCSDLEGSSSQRGTKVFHRQWLKSQTGAGGGAEQITSGNTEVHLHQCGEVRNHTSAVGGAGRLTSGNEAPEQGLSFKFLEELDSVIGVLRGGNKSPEGRQKARACARNMAFQVPEDVLQVFAEIYQKEYNPSRRAEGKEEERYPGAAGRA